MQSKIAARVWVAIPKEKLNKVGRYGQQIDKEGFTCCICKVEIKGSIAKHRAYKNCDKK